VAAGRGLSRLEGNRIWRVETAQGPVLQKLYAERGSWWRTRARDFAGRLRGGKTGTRAAARRATEARLLALWRAHGCDVPAELSARHPDLAGERVLVLEFVDGPLLSALLADASLPRARRHELIGRFAADLAARHARALAEREPALVQEHAGVQHVLVAPLEGGAAAAVAALPVGALRFVSFDLENAFTSRAIEPLVHKEIAGCVRSLARCGRPDERRMREDVEAFVRGYADRSRLAAAAESYLRPASLTWRIVWAIDRWREARKATTHGKFVMLGVLESVLKSAPS
jgi:hypothetical protein